MSPFHFRRRKPLDLVAAEIADLEQRSEAAADVLEPFRHLVASGGWCAPATVDYGLLDLPEIKVTRGGLNVGGIVTPASKPKPAYWRAPKSTSRFKKDALYD